MGWGKLIFGKGAEAASRLRDVFRSMATAPVPEPPRSGHDLLAHRDGLADVRRWSFCATMQLRTPLRVLQQHGEIAHGPAESLPLYTREMWQGIWVPEPEDGGLGLLLSAGASMASEVGPIPIDGGDYACFLKAFRVITEGQTPVREMEKALRALLRETGPGGTSYRRYYKTNELIELVLPRSITQLPIPKAVAKRLAEAGMDTLGKVAKSPDADLLAINGLGGKSLVGIRQWLNEHPYDPDAKRFLQPEFGALD